MITKKIDEYLNEEKSIGGIKKVKVLKDVYLFFSDDEVSIDLESGHFDFEGIEKFKLTDGIPKKNILTTAFTAKTAEELSAVVRVLLDNSKVMFKDLSTFIDALKAAKEILKQQKKS